jgi:glycosyltransferase involved in cell wall biosynthesis
MIQGLIISSLLFTGTSAIAVGVHKKEILSSLEEEPPYVVEGPLVSVVIPALEEEKYLPNLLISLQNQTYRPIEVLVVDQSPPESHDSTQEICLEYGATLVYSPIANVARARNEGAEAATSNMLVFTDADNVFTPTAIENLVNALQRGYVLANPVHCVYDDGPYSIISLWANNWFKTRTLTTCAVAVWKDAFFQVGGYDETCDPMLGCSEDTKLGRDIAQRFGVSSMKLVRDALVGTSARRRNKEGLVPRWKSRTVRVYVH